MLPAVLAVACLSASAGNAGAQGSTASDRAALQALYNVAGGDRWEHGTNWLTDAPLRDWYGIETGASGRVTIVSLAGNGLAGRIPSELGQLGRLEELWLTGNALSGEIPPELGNLVNLEVLSLAANRLSGSIPAALGTLTSLEQLNLNDNALSGSIPTTLGNLSNLVDLSLDDNLLTNGIPASLGNLHGLKWLDFTRNALTGDIPADLGRLSNLSRSWLGDNALNGPIPPGLGSLGSLAELSLAGNALAGAVPDALGNLISLESLYLNDNATLSGPVPLRLMFLAHLESVDIRNTALCAPEDVAFRTWAATIDFQGCSDPDGGGGGGGGGGGSRVRAAFEFPAYTAIEGEPGTPVTVMLSAAPGRTVTIPLTSTPASGATAADYTVEPAEVTFSSRATEALVMVTAVDDAHGDDGESVVIGLGGLPARVSVGDQAVATVTLRDNNVTASFARPVYAVAEGGPSVPVTVRLSAPPGREVAIPLTTDAGGGTTAADHAGVPASVTFGSSDAEQTFNVTASADAEDDDGETIVVGFGPLPPEMIAGNPSTATVAIADAGGPRFADELSAGGTVRAVHLMELRLRAAALRLALGLEPFRWTDGIIEPGVTPIRASHLTELRTAVGEAYDIAGQTRPPYIEGPVRVGVTSVRAAHFLELRSAILVLERPGR